MAKRTAKQIISESLPGMEIVKKQPAVVADFLSVNSRSGNSMATLQQKFSGPSIDSLKRKFLGDSTFSIAKPVEDSVTDDDDIEVVTVRSKNFTKKNEAVGEELTVIISKKQDKVLVIQG